MHIELRDVSRTFDGHSGGAVAAGEIAVLTAGLPEYEARPQPAGLELSVTLLRCVGWLSRDDLASRPGHAGPQLAVPEAQCPGRHAFAYAVVIGTLDDTALVTASTDFRTDLEVGPDGADLSAAPRLAGDPVAFSALKGAEDREGLILRVFNPGEEAAHLRIGRHAEAARLDEAPDSARPESMTLGAGRIGTYRIR